MQCLKCEKEISEAKFYLCKECRTEIINSIKIETWLKTGVLPIKPDSTIRGIYRTYIYREQNGRCAVCGIGDIWEGKKLHFILDHIDGDAANSSRTNLRLICPNCDSQTDTFKSKNKNSARVSRKGGASEIRWKCLSCGTELKVGTPVMYCDMCLKEKIILQCDADNTKITSFVNQHNLRRPRNTNRKDSCLCPICSNQKNSKSKMCLSCYRKQQRVKIPSKEQLYEDLKTSNFAQVGRKYSVSDNAVRKWCKKYDLPTSFVEWKSIKLLK